MLFFGVSTNIANQAKKKRGGLCFGGGGISRDFTVLVLTILPFIITEKEGKGKRRSFSFPASSVSFSRSTMLWSLVDLQRALAAEAQRKARSACRRPGPRLALPFSLCQGLQFDNEVLPMMALRRTGSKASLAAASLWAFDFLPVRDLPVSSSSLNTKPSSARAKEPAPLSFSLARTRAASLTSTLFPMSTFQEQSSQVSITACQVRTLKPQSHCSYTIQ